MVNNRSTDRNGSLSVFGFLVDDFLRRWRTSFAMVKVCVCMRGPAPSPRLLLLGGSFLRFTDLCLQRLRLVSRGTKRIARTVCSSRSCSRFALVYLYPCAWLASTTALLSANVMYFFLVCYAEYFMTWSKTPAPAYEIIVPANLARSGLKKNLSGKIGIMFLDLWY